MSGTNRASLAKRLRLDNLFMPGIKHQLSSVQRNSVLDKSLVLQYHYDAVSGGKVCFMVLPSFQ